MGFFEILSVITPVMIAICGYFIFKLDKKFDKIDARFDKIDTRFDAMDKKIGDIDKKFDKKFEESSGKLEGLRVEMHSGIIKLSDRISHIEGILWATHGYPQEKRKEN